MENKFFAILIEKLELDHTDKNQEDKFHEQLNHEILQVSNQNKKWMEEIFHNTDAV